MTSSHQRGNTEGNNTEKHANTQLSILLFLHICSLQFYDANWFQFSFESKCFSGQFLIYLVIAFTHYWHYLLIDVNQAKLSQKGWSLIDCSDQFGFRTPGKWKKNNDPIYNSHEMKARYLPYLGYYWIPLIIHGYNLGVECPFLAQVVLGVQSFFVAFKLPMGVSFTQNWMMAACRGLKRLVTGPSTNKFKKRPLGTVAERLYVLNVNSQLPSSLWIPERGRASVLPD